MSLSPGTRIGAYEVVAQLGAGGMGEVYRAHDTKLNRDVAIKVLAELVATDPERLARFQTTVFGGGASVNNWYWDATADGQRFLINSLSGGAEPSTLNVVLNWQSGSRGDRLDALYFHERHPARRRPGTGAPHAP